MAASHPLDRLLRIRHLEEEQRRQALASALAELEALESAQARSMFHSRKARQLMVSGMVSGDPLTRQAGFVEAHNSVQRAVVLEEWIGALKQHAEQVRIAWTEKRIERKQAETLVETARTQAAIEATRQIQQTLDQSHLAARRESLRRNREKITLLHDFARESGEES